MFHGFRVERPTPVGNVNSPGQFNLGQTQEWFEQTQPGTVGVNLVKRQDCNVNPFWLRFPALFVGQLDPSVVPDLLQQVMPVGVLRLQLEFGDERGLRLCESALTSPDKPHGHALRRGCWVRLNSAIEASQRLFVVSLLEKPFSLLAELKSLLLRTLVSPSSSPEEAPFHFQKPSQQPMT